MDRDRWNATGWAFVLIGILLLAAVTAVFGAFGDAWPSIYYSVVVRVQEVFIALLVSLLSLGVLIVSFSS